MSTGTIVRIEKIENGFVICATDPKAVEANKNPKAPYRSTEVEYAFDTFEEVLRWLKAQKDNLIPQPDDASEYESAFNQATKEK